MAEAIIFITFINHKKLIIGFIIDRLFKQPFKTNNFFLKQKTLRANSKRHSLEIDLTNLHITRHLLQQQLQEVLE